MLLKGVSKIAHARHREWLALPLGGLALAVVALALMVGCTGGSGLKDYKLSLSPTALQIGQNELDLLVSDARGRPLTDLSVSFDCVHRTMEMPKQVVAASPGVEGHYRGVVTISHTGSWAMFVEVSRGGQRLGRREFNYDVKQ